jgi:hypothetical protein
MYTMEYYSVLRREAILIHATIWMKLDIMVNGLNQSQKVK